MLLLVGKAHPSVMALRARVGTDVGRLLTPRASLAMPAPAPYPWAVDNDAFTGFDAPRYVRLLDRLAGRESDALFVVAPDHVGDHDATCDLWERWAPYLRERGFTPAFALQDGATDVWDVPHDAGALFVGGSDGFKLGEGAAAIVRAVKRRGMWVHMGRVNTVKRMRYASSIGVDSIDGTKWARFTDAWTHQLHDLAYDQQGFVL